MTDRVNDDEMNELFAVNMQGYINGMLIVHDQLLKIKVLNFKPPAPY